MGLCLYIHDTGPIKGMTMFYLLYTIPPSIPAALSSPFIAGIQTRDLWSTNLTIQNDKLDLPPVGPAFEQICLVKSVYFEVLTSWPPSRMAAWPGSSK